MTPGDVRTIDELAARCALHPELRDIYVEGPEDTHFLTWFLLESPKHNAVVYDITTVDVPKTIIAKYKTPSNNRFRVIALARELEAILGKDTLQITCIADRDFDIVLNINHQCTLLLLTDYTCIEMYSFTEKCLQKLFNIFVLGFPYSPSHTLAQISKPLQELFLIRLANELMALNLRWIDFDRCCTIAKGEITFDSNEFVHRYLNSNSMLSKKEAFLNCIDSLRGKLTSNPRYQIQGHDYLRLLSLYLKRHGITGVLSNQTVIQRALCECVEYPDLIHEALFGELLARL